MSAQRNLYLTEHEYLEMERAADYKSEYYAGELYAMAGASPRHVMITTNTAGAFLNLLRGRPCYTYSSDLRLLVSPTGLYTYPDVVVVCGKPQFDDPREDTLLNPTVIIEVLSPSTEAYDRGAKFSQYRRLESLTDYLLISQDRALVEHYVRQPDEGGDTGEAGMRWLLTAYQGLGNTVIIPSIDVALPLSEIYDKVEWPDEESGATTLRVVKEPGNDYALETTMSDSLPSFYFDLADWWPMLSAPTDYAEEAAIYRQILLDACQKPPHEVLELGSGGGNNASHLKAHFTLTLVDLSPGMLAVSRALNPECQHLEGDMRTVRLGRKFDAVFVHDAVSYLTSEEDLRQAMITAFVHCRSGGAALFCPDQTRESFRSYASHGGHDASDGSGRGLRYVEWTRDPDPDDTTCVMDMCYLLLEADGTVRSVYDQHVEGLFSRDTWLRLLAEVGFTPKLIIEEDEELWDSGGGELFVGVKP